MNKITTPSRAQASWTNFLTSPVRSMKSRPDVSIVSSEVTAVSAVTADSAVRDADLGKVIEASTNIFRIFLILMSALARLEGWELRREASPPHGSRRARCAPHMRTSHSNLAADILLHP